MTVNGSKKKKPLIARRARGPETYLSGNSNLGGAIIYLSEGLISMVKIKRVFYDLYLLAKSFPGVFMTKRGNAILHLNHVCPKCPLWRREMRFVFRNKCFWESNWKKVILVFLEFI